MLGSICNGNLLGKGKTRKQERNQRQTKIGKEMEGAYWDFQLLSVRYLKRTQKTVFFFYFSWKNEEVNTIWFGAGGQTADDGGAPWPPRDSAKWSEVGPAGVREMDEANSGAQLTARPGAGGEWLKQMCLAVEVVVNKDEADGRAKPNSRRTWPTVGWLRRKAMWSKPIHVERRCVRLEMGVVDVGGGHWWRSDYT